MFDSSCVNVGESLMDGFYKFLQHWYRMMLDRVKKLFVCSARLKLIGYSARVELIAYSA